MGKCEKIRQKARDPGKRKVRHVIKAKRRAFDGKKRPRARQKGTSLEKEEKGDPTKRKSVPKAEKKGGRQTTTSRTCSGSTVRHFQSSAPDADHRKEG